MSANILERTREFGVMHAIGAAPKAVRRIVVAEGVVIAFASCLIAVVPTLALTALMGTGLGNAPVVSSTEERSRGRSFPGQSI